MIVNSLVPDEFRAFIMEAVLKSESLYAVKRRDEIEVSPEFAKLFLESKTYSSTIVDDNSI